MKTSTWMGVSAAFFFLSAVATAFSHKPVMAALPASLGAFFVALAYRGRKEGR